MCCTVELTNKQDKQSKHVNRLAPGLVLGLGRSAWAGGPARPGLVGLGLTAWPGGLGWVGPGLVGLGLWAWAGEPGLVSLGWWGWAAWSAWSF
jgi:hypothetical protein